MRYIIKLSFKDEYVKDLNNGRLTWSYDINEALKFATNMQAWKFVGRYVDEDVVVITTGQDPSDTKDDAYDRAMGVV